MEKRRLFSFATFEDKMDLLRGIVILIVLGLTTASFLRLCSQACSEGHQYLILGMSFETVGFLFFGLLAFLHLYGKYSPNARQLEQFGFCCALGAETVFTGVQKYLIGTWCPVCLTIASCVGIGVLSYVLSEIKHYQEGKMKTLLKGGIKNFMAIAAGFFIAFMGISKHDAMEAAESTVQKRLAFGNLNSPIEVYIFTDWFCPACKKLEPRAEELTDAIGPHAKITFVDEAIHPESLNFTPFNLAFLINNKAEYFKLRHMLTELSLSTKTPTEEQVEQGAAKLGVRFHELHYADISMGASYYKQLSERFKVDSTPTMIIINAETKKGKKLEGPEEITKENALKAIEALKNAS